MSEGSSEIKSRHQRAGFLWKLPMSKASGEKWQKRMFMAKDGFLLYYGEKSNPKATHFDTKPKGVIPLGGCKVELVERGPKGSKFGLKISHPDFVAGRFLVLAAEKEEEQKAWEKALNDCSRVTMENALLGDSMIEKLRSAGTAAEKEKDDVMQKLQEQALALRVETEEKLKLLSDQDKYVEMVKEADERAAKKEAEMAAALAEMEKRREELAVEAKVFEDQIAQRSNSLKDAANEYEKVQQMIAAARAAATEKAQASADTAFAAAAAATGVSDGGAASSSSSGAPGGDATAPASSGSGAMPSASAAASSSSAAAQQPRSEAGSASGAGATSASASSGASTVSAGAAAGTPTAAGQRSRAGSAAGSSSAAAPAVHVDRAQIAAAAGLSLAEFEAIEKRARDLEEQKLRLEREKIALERSMKDMKQHSDSMKGQLESSEAARKRLEAQMNDLGGEESDLAKERQLRKRLERKLQIAEDSLKRLDGALRRGGVKLDVDVFADVKTLLSFFEERAEEAKRDAQRIEIMKQALKAKRKYLMASAKVEGVENVADVEQEEADEDDAWDDHHNDAPAPAPAPKAAAQAAAPAPALVAAPVPAPAPAPAPARKETMETDGWGSDDEEQKSDWGSEEGDSDAEDGAAKAGAQAAGAASSTVRFENGIKIETVDELGVLPAGWVKQTDQEGDTWFYNGATGETSWVRPNPDGSVPAA